LPVCVTRQDDVTTGKDWGDDLPSHFMTLLSPPTLSTLKTWPPGLQNVCSPFAHVFRFDPPLQRFTPIAKKIVDQKGSWLESAIRRIADSEFVAVFSLNSIGNSQN